ncbi:MAG: hemolysin family protein [Candidatus Omnitrophica bacterium]|nr:hemolysin family protein [Candidatus Omnitrophota bacterium]
MMPILLHVFVLVVLLAFSGFFSGSETAIFSLSKIERRRIMENHPRLARWVLFHIDHPRRTLITVLIGNMFVNTFAASLVTLLAVDIWGYQVLGWTTLAFTLVLILVGEVLPKVLAVKKNVVLALCVALPLEGMAILFYPFRLLTRWVTDGIMSVLIRERKEPTDIISEDELRALVKIGEEEGIFDRDERRMMQKLFEFEERPVKVIMTPRTDMVALDLEDPESKQIEIVKKYHFSHYPVYQHTIDEILGVISIQDYMLSEKRDLRSLMTQPMFIPETKRIDDLLEDFRKRNQKFAVCVDEYGGTAGIVTLEDILEEIFGEFYDEYAKVEQPIRRLWLNEFMVDARISLDDFNEYFSSTLQAGEAATLGGFILEKLGEVPQKGKVLRTPEFEIRIHEVIRQRIRKVIVVPLK